MHHARDQPYQRAVLRNRHFGAEYWRRTNQNTTTKEKEKMARKPMVTRTIVTTIATVLCLDLEKKEPFEKEVKIPRTYKDEKHMMKAVESAVNSDKVKAVHILSTRTEETLYGMTEQKFIENAEILPNREIKE